MSAFGFPLDRLTKDEFKQLCKNVFHPQKGGLVESDPIRRAEAEEELEMLGGSRE